jgi:hypothetical protein
MRPAYDVHALQVNLTVCLAGCFEVASEWPTQVLGLGRPRGRVQAKCEHCGQGGVYQTPIATVDAMLGCRTLGQCIARAWQQGKHVFQVGVLQPSS